MILAQAADAVTALGPFDWKHLVLALLIPAAGYVGQWLGTRGVALLESKLRSAGHPQAAEAVDLLVANFVKVATAAEKQALAQQAASQGVDHPAIRAATGGVS